MNRKTIVIGDIHGCYAEFERLLEKISPGEKDRVILLGDLVNRGPDSVRVIEIAMREGFESVIGNHEFRLLRYRKTGSPGVLKDYDFRTVASLAERHWKYMETMRTSLATDDPWTVVVHGGFLPMVPWGEQNRETVCQLKYLRAGQIPQEDLFRNSAIRPHWSEIWKGPQTVLYGHTPRARIDLKPYAIGLDTGCVYGNRLSACILPEVEFVQVRARKAYI